jgi:putative ABC transport system permease protein
MNIFQLVIKQMRQRALSTWLTLLSVALGVALAIAIMIVRREGQAIFGQTDYGYDVLVGAKGSPLQLVLNTVYQIDRSPGNIPYSMYEKMVAGGLRAQVKLAVPYAVGDSYQNHRIIGTLPTLFGFDDEGVAQADRFEYRPEKYYEFAEGRVFHPRKFEAVIGSDVSARTGLKIGQKFKATHGTPLPNQSPDEHDTEWEVVGVLAPTHTAADRVLFIPLETFYAIADHEQALEAMSQIKQGADPTKLASPKPAETPATDDHDHDHAHDEAFTMNPDGTLNLHLPKNEWQVSAILVKSRSPFAAQQLMWTINNQNQASAVNPASVMREFFNTFLSNGATVLLMISFLVIIVAAASIVTSIYNSVAARKREIAILRALGATRYRILGLICLEAAVVGLVGGLVGFAVGHAVAGVGSVYMNQIMGEQMNWLRFGPEEGWFLVLVVILATLAGLVPGLKAYRTPVANNLVST